VRRDHRFQQEQKDVIKLNQIDASSTARRRSLHFIGTANFHKVAGELRYAISGSTTTIQGDVNGDGVADFWLKVAGRMALVQADFVL
jgi:serralysin